MAKPAGVQIKRWFMILIILLITVNIISVLSFFVVYSKINEIKAAYQPIVKSSAAINSKILSAQIDLYKYLSEYQDDLGSVYIKTKGLTNELKNINSIVKEANIKALDVKLLDGVLESTEKFESAIKRLDSIDEQGVVDWDRVNELRDYAATMGTEASIKIESVNNEINLLITNHNIRVTLIALIVVCILFAFLILSFVIMIQLHYWWKKFEDLILEL